VAAIRRLADPTCRPAGKHLVVLVGQKKAVAIAVIETEGMADCRQLITSCLFYPRKQLYPDPITDVREVSTETLSKAALTTVMWTFEAFSELALWTGLGGERKFAVGVKCYVVP